MRAERDRRGPGQRVLCHARGPFRPRAVRRDLEEIVNAGATEVEKSKIISADLVSIARDMNIILAGNKEILDNSGETVRVVKEVQTGVEEIAAAAQQTTRASTEAGVATRQQSKGAEELAAAIEEIASLADELQAAA